jgi:hypothetical protein
MWMIELLTSEVMIKKPNYWKEVFQRCEVNPIEPNDDMSLKVLSDIGMFQFQDEIMEISQRIEK